ncbi:MAG: biopolymer transporter ExbD [Planctomycetota bacterium]
MAENPTKPKQDPESEEDEGEEMVVHHVSQAKKRKKGVGGEQMELQLTSMIDVIFQLLIYFIITANFVIDEGTIKAKLPGDSAVAKKLEEKIPTNIYIETSGDAIDYELRVDNTPVESISELYGVLYSRLESGRLDADDPVTIHPQGRVRWQHVVNVFNACVRADLESVAFAQPKPGAP